MKQRIDFLDILESKHILVIKLGQTMVYYIRKTFIEKFYKKYATWKLVPGAFVLMRK